MMNVCFLIEFWRIISSRFTCTLLTFHPSIHSFRSTKHNFLLLSSCSLSLGLLIVNVCALLCHPFRTFSPLLPALSRLSIVGFRWEWNVDKLNWSVTGFNPIFQRCSQTCFLHFFITLSFLSELHFSTVTLKTKSTVSRFFFHPHWSWNCNLLSTLRVWINLWFISNDERWWKKFSPLLWMKKENANVPARAASMERTSQQQHSDSCWVWSEICWILLETLQTLDNNCTWTNASIVLFWLLCMISPSFQFFCTTCWFC